jgi:TPR repeat protein
MNRVLLGLVLLLSLSSAYAGSCYEGDVAVCKAEAEQGNARAPINLGWMYYSGVVVIQDDVMAHMYWNIAVASGAENAAEWRGMVAKSNDPITTSRSPEVSTRVDA